MEGNIKHGLSFINVYKDQTEDKLDQIVAFWNSLNSIPQNEDPRERARQVIFMVKNEEGEVAAVSTAYITKAKMLGKPVFMYRCLIHPNFRIPGLVHILAQSTIEYLESIHKEISPRCIGVMAKIESSILKRNRTVVSKSGMIFIGFAPDGCPLRIHYFKGAQF